MIQDAFFTHLELCKKRCLFLLEEKGYIKIMSLVISSSYLNAWIYLNLGSFPIGSATDVWALILCVWDGIYNKEEGEILQGNQIFYFIM